MRIVQTQSHLGGLEFLMTRKRTVWDDIADSIAASSSPVRGTGQPDLTVFEDALSWAFPNRNWSETRTRECTLTPDGQGQSKSRPSEFVTFQKDRVMVQCSSWMGIHRRLRRLEWLAGLYRLDEIDVGVEILPAEEWLSRNFESRSDPRVPLVFVGVVDEAWPALSHRESWI